MVKQKTLLDFDPWLESHKASIVARTELINEKKQRFLNGNAIGESSLGYLYFGLHKTNEGWLLREWAPHAHALFLVGDFNDWQDSGDFKFKKTSAGNWELHVPAHAIKFGQNYKLHVYFDDEAVYRIPAYARYVTQNEETKAFHATVFDGGDFRWSDDNFNATCDQPLIYEAHIGMASQEEKVASYKEFTKNILPRIKAAGYNTVQLMAIAEHPYYGSFGYHVSNYFAPSSRFGTPNELKELIDTAHGMGLAVIMDIVHSHSVKNEEEGLSRFDGTTTQYFHAGDRGNHVAWDSRCFDYGKPEVVNFLLSNCRYWIDEFHFDGFRFDGVTSMIYTHHGLEKSFSSYDDYFGNDVDIDALTYLSLANDLIHELKPNALSIAEDMSALPGLAMPSKYGGIGFDYRMSMGVPDIWIKTLKEKKDEDWDLSHLFHELTTHRPEERVISYSESHDQALVGDKTLIFRLIDKEMYWHMQANDDNLVVERGIALHKMIRLFTASTHGGGYLNFIGNEFGHPEWIDFPREGNDWSYKHARRQWDLVDNKKLKYRWLGEFDKGMLSVVNEASSPFFEYVYINNDDGVIAFKRGDFIFAFNFSPTESYPDYGLAVPAGDYKIVLSSDAKKHGGQDRIDETIIHHTTKLTETDQVKIYLPARTALVLKKIKTS
jgi:1,4-alpha-glucan branching enzyme